MNIFERIASRLFPVPIQTTALSTAFAEANQALRNKQISETLRLANAELILARQQLSAGEEWQKQRARDEQQEYREALQTIGVSATTPQAMREAGATTAAVQLVERLWDLELALEDRGWTQELSIANFEFSLWGIQRIIAICRLYALKNPLVRRGVEIDSCYVFGRGYSISSDDETENAVLQEFFTSPRNIVEFGHAGMMRKNGQMWTDGNIYFIFFRDEKTGELVCRTIDPIEIVEIICDPNDASQEWYFRRRWMSQVFVEKVGRVQPKPEEAWYPSVKYQPPVKPPTMGDTQVRIMWDTPVKHSKWSGIGKSQFGVPLAYPAIDYARAVKNLIDNWCSIQEAMARFAWQVETQGGIPAIAALKQTFATTLATGDGQMYEQNPPPTTASTWISGPGNKLSMSKTSGMIDSPEVGRRVAHMVYMVFGFPETFWADASVGTVATATSLDRPTELRIMATQERWREEIQDIGGIALESSAQAPGGKIQEARASGKSKRSTIKVDFPSVLEHEIGAQIAAIIAAGTLNGFEITGVDQRVLIGLLLQELQVENWQDVLEAMYPEDEYEPLINRTELMAAQREDALNPPAPPAPGVGGNTGTPTPAPVDDKNPATGAQPQSPKPKSPKPKRMMTPAESAKLQRALEALTKASKAMRAHV